MTTHPQSFKTYEINFQEKGYEVVAEVLFALIINEFKQIVENEYIITKTMIELPVNNKTLNSRILTALDAIGLKEIELEEEDEITYDYKDQGDILTELLERDALEHCINRKVHSQRS